MVIVGIKDEAMDMEKKEDGGAEYYVEDKTNILLMISQSLTDGRV